MGIMRRVLDRRKSIMFALFCMKTIEYAWKEEEEITSLVSYMKDYIQQKISIDDLIKKSRDIKYSAKSSVIYLNEIRYLTVVLLDLFEDKEPHARLNYVSSNTVYFAGLHHKKTGIKDDFEIERIKDKLLDDHIRYLQELEEIDLIMENILKGE